MPATGDAAATTREPVRIAVFASGRGSTFNAIVQALAARPDAPAEVVLCISNNPHPGAFEYAESAGIAAARLSPRMFSTEDEYVIALRDTLHSFSIEMIVLAGYMRKLPADIVREYTGRILNIHPALLPKFGGQGMYGRFVHAAVIEACEQETGATVHLVDESYDTGPIIAQERVPVDPGDTPEQLAERVLAVEHRLYPRVVIDWARRLAQRRAASSATQGSAAGHTNNPELPGSDR